MAKTKKTLTRSDITTAILAVRDSARTNMMDIPNVARVAHSLGYRAESVFLASVDARKGYGPFVFRGDDSEFPETVEVSY